MKSFRFTLVAGILVAASSSIAPVQSSHINSDNLSCWGYQRCQSESTMADAATNIQDTLCWNGWAQFKRPSPVSLYGL